MKVGLIDIDSKIPNLALMKLSQYHKQLNHKVELIPPLIASTCQDNYDLIIASKVFDFTEMPCLPEKTHLGGSGIDFKKKLINPVEHIYPDYNLYGCNYAIGYTSRGCNRRCPFCIVPEKEGKFKIVCDDIREFWRGQNLLMLLDNSLNTDEEHFLDICEQVLNKNIAIDFSQGLDIRHLTDIQALALSQLKPWGQTPFRFAWDFIRIEKQVRTGIEILRKHGIEHKSMFYVLIGFNTTVEEDLYRVEILRNLGVEPFVMPFNKFNEYQKAFARYVNYKAIFRSVKWEDYKWYKLNKKKASGE